MTNADTQGASWQGEFSRQVYRLVRQIPPGRIVTYGQIARQIPAPPGIDPAAYALIRARWVGYALARCPDELPWHRVVNQRGQISGRLGHGPHVQPILLEREAVRPDRAGIYSLDRYGWEFDRPAPGPAAPPRARDRSP